MAKFWIFTGMFAEGLLSQFLLMRYAEGAVYAVIIGALATPGGALFWSCFKPNPLRWDPAFTYTTAFTLAGLAIMVPAIIVYNLFSLRDAELTAKRESDEQMV